VSSRDGYARADIDTGLFDDPKVKRLVRLQRDPMLTLATISVYVAALLSSWRENAPQPALDAAPGWADGEVLDRMIRDLRAVGLLDRRASIRSESLDRWMGSLRARSDHARTAAEARWHQTPGRPEKAPKNARAKRSHSPSKATAMPSQPASMAGAARAQASPAGPPAQAPARGGSDGRGLKEVLKDMGMEPNLEVTK
jgi:hypothetical protein